LPEVFRCMQHSGHLGHCIPQRPYQASHEERWTRSIRVSLLLSTLFSRPLHHGVVWRAASCRANCSTKIWAGGLIQRKSAPSPPSPNNGPRPADSALSGTSSYEYLVYTLLSPILQTKLPPAIKLPHSAHDLFISSLTLSRGSQCMHFQLRTVRAPTTRDGTSVRIAQLDLVSYHR